MSTERVEVFEGIDDNGADVWLVTLLDADGTAVEFLHTCHDAVTAAELADVERRNGRPAGDDGEGHAR